jgi:hypothetical protein
MSCAQMLMLFRLFRLDIPVPDVVTKFHAQDSVSLVVPFDS